MAGIAPPSSFPMAGLEPPSTYPMDVAAPTSIIPMDAAATPAPPSSMAASAAPPSTSPTAAAVPPSTSPKAAPAPPSNSSIVGLGPEQSFISSMAAPAAPPSTSTTAVTGDARKKRPRRELPRSGCKKNKKIVLVQEEPVKGSANSALVMMESKVKKRNKKGAGAGGLPAGIDLEIREAEQYLATDAQEMTLEEYEKMQEKKKSLEASKPEERRVAAVDFEGLQLLEKKIEDDAKLKAENVRKAKEAAAKEAKPCKRASPRVYSPKIVASSPGVNMLARAAALKRVSVSSAVRHASAKRANLADQLETPASQRTPQQNTQFKIYLLQQEDLVPMGPSVDAAS